MQNNVKTIGVTEKLKVKNGVFVLKVIRGSGWVDIYVCPNLIVNQGLDYLARNIVGVDSVNINYIVVSDDTTTPSPDETTLPGTNKWSVLATKSHPANRRAQWSGTFAKGAIVGSIGRIGLCLNSDGSGLFATVLRTPTLNLGADDQLQVNYTVEFTR